MADRGCSNRIHESMWIIHEWIDKSNKQSHFISIKVALYKYGFTNYGVRNRDIVMKQTVFCQSASF